MNVWTFFGHWEDDRIVIEYVIPGVVEDPRIDTGYWEQGLWSDSGAGESMEDAERALIAQYEDNLPTE